MDLAGRRPLSMPRAASVGKFLLRAPLPPPLIHSRDPRRAGGGDRPRPLLTREPRSGRGGGAHSPARPLRPPPTPAPTRRNRRRPSPPGAAPATAAAPPTPSCSAPAGRSRRAGPTCLERPPPGPRPTPPPRPRPAPAAPETEPSRAQGGRQDEEAAAGGAGRSGAGRGRRQTNARLLGPPRRRPSGNQPSPWGAGPGGGAAGARALPRSLLTPGVHARFRTPAVFRSGPGHRPIPAAAAAPAGIGSPRAPLPAPSPHPQSPRRLPLRPSRRHLLHVQPPSACSVPHPLRALNPLPQPAPPEMK